MEFSEPLPLIRIRDTIEDPQESDQENYDSILWYGYLILLCSWVLFVMSINSIFELWKFIIHPLSVSERTIPIYKSLQVTFECTDRYILKLWCIYIIVWWWSIISWTGLKLFRHSKGIQTQVS
ncbi:uncharacterized protein RJT21DRAFT_48252 [Scheffersomyces amazonensis]|uniref:uncharacterized protein n=1 Tax=Scheffersomyces amazonensis TaxID=1078765 RepID=UPI00315D9C81